MLPDHEARHVSDSGWKGVPNGELIEAAEKAGYEVLITADKNLAYQQNLRDRRLPLIVIASNTWKDVQRNLARIEQAVERIEIGSYQEVHFESVRSKRREPGRHER